VVEEMGVVVGLVFEECGQDAASGARGILGVVDEYLEGRVVVVDNKMGLKMQWLIPASYTDKILVRGLEATERPVLTSRRGCMVSGTLARE